MVAAPCYIGRMKDQKPAPNRDDIELHPDAWDRFTDFVKRIAKAGPQHRTPKTKERPASKGARSQGEDAELRRSDSRCLNVIPVFWCVLSKRARSNHLI
jgi:hypothetical protein